MRATNRVQLHAGFTFDDAAAQVDCLAERFPILEAAEPAVVAIFGMDGDGQLFALGVQRRG